MYFKNEPKDRALAAYYRSAATMGGSVNQPGQVEEMEHEGKRYVVLANVNGVLACYRVQNNGQLRVMKRPPAKVIEAFA